ncbi:hypothetical protein F1C12_21735 (plasmid) [Leifsonia shinshuensis]|uniref:Uncharacterized protein n=2 Tax=Leifsonia shinshuensis TaxID=150026 RepID=A0A7G6YHE3_9MICO|nr:hypothetical protein F1C12_21735 [Leifsonia shinshuensis]
MTGHTKIADPLPGRGGAIQLVRYFPTRDGWASEIIEGKYLSATRSTIKIRGDDQTVELDREKWAVCMADPSWEAAPAPVCAAIRTFAVDDPEVRDIRPVGSGGKQQAGTRECSQCGAEVTVTQRLNRGVPTSAWLYEEHTVPEPGAAAEEATSDVA